MAHHLYLFAILMLVLLPTGCARPARLHQTWLPFTEKVFGEYPKLKETLPQKAGGISASVTRSSFRELTLAQGSGLTGFDTVRIYSDGTGYVVIGDHQAGAAKLPIKLTETVMKELIESLRADRVASLKGCYSSDLNDGTQGFVQVVTSSGTVASWFNNYFTPLRHLWKFANKHVWPDIIHQQPPPLLDRHYDRQGECYRVFPRVTR